LVFLKISRAIFEKELNTENTELAHNLPRDELQRTKRFFVV